MRDRGQTDKLNTRRELVRNRGGDSQRQAGFSGASGAGEAQQPNIVPEQQLAGLRHLLFSSDERSARDWQIDERLPLQGSLSGKRRVQPSGRRDQCFRMRIASTDFDYLRQ